MGFLELVDELDQLIGSSPRMPVTNQPLVKEQDLVALLARLRASIPPEAQQAQQSREQREHVLARARADADELLLRAQEEVYRLVNDPHLVRDARARAEEELRDAEAKAALIRANAESFVSARLESFEQMLTDLETVLSRDIAAVRSGVQALAERVAGGLKGGELPIRPEAPLLPATGIREEYHMPPGESMPNPEPGGGPNSPFPNSPLAG